MPSGRGLSFLSMFQFRKIKYYHSFGNRKTDIYNKITYTAVLAPFGVSRRILFHCLYTVLNYDRLAVLDSCDIFLVVSLWNSEAKKTAKK